MKSRGWYLLVAAVGLVVWGSAGADEPEAGVAYTVRDVITIGSTERPPAIDGKGDDLTWGRGTKIPLVVPGSDGRAPANEVVAQVTRDDTALYVLFAVDDRKTERRGTKPTAAAPIWEQHSVELVLDLGADARSYHHFAVNEDNQQFAMAFLEGGGFANPVPQGSWASATGRSAQGWLAEIAIPWESIGLAPKAGMLMGMNLIANQPGGNGTVSYQGDATNLRHPAAAGVVAFGADWEPDRPKLKILSLDTEGGRCVIEVEARGRAYPSSNFGLLHRLTIPGQPPVESITSMNLRNNKASEVTLGPVPIGEAGPGSLVLAARRGMKIIRVLAVTFPVQPATP